jgi:hypothetical protein
VSAVQEHLRAAQARQAASADRHRRRHDFSVGDRVLLSSGDFNVSKLAPRYFGPFAVTECVSPVALRLDLPPSFGKRHRVFHVSKLRPFLDGVAYPGRAALRPPALSMDADGVGSWNLEAVVGKRVLRRRGRRVVEYEVKWVGWPSSDNTWEPAGRLQRDQPAAVAAYEASA